MTALSLSRRNLLRTGGVMLVALTASPRRARAQSSVPVRVLATDEVDGFLAIATDGTVTLYSGKVDLGTGARAAYRQIVAEELELDPSRVQLVEGDTALTPNQGPTAGSNGIQVAGMQFRRAAATARAALLKLAAAKLAVPEVQLTLQGGAIRAATGASVGFGELIGGKAFDLKLDNNAPLKKPADYRIVGKPFPRPDLPDKFTGKHEFVHDIRRPGMLHARVVRPPTYGATLQSVDESSLATIPGARVVRMGSFLAVVAEKEWNAVRAARALKASWSDETRLGGSRRLYEDQRGAKVERDADIATRGDAPGKLATASKVLTATYQWPLQSHASLGPSCAVAEVTADRATIWTASQGTHKYQPLFAKFLGLPATAVRLIYVDGAGCYGMNGHDDAAAEAALLSKSLGKPVRVQWSREDEHAWDPKGPAQILDMRGALDANGRIGAWETRTWLPANTQGLPAVPLLAVDAAGFSQPQGYSSGLTQANADPPYTIADMRALVHWVAPGPIRLSNLRAPGKIANLLAVECFTDELAAAAGADPVAFRLAALSQPRGEAALRRTAEMMNWQPRQFPLKPDGAVARGRGIAYCHYKHNETFVAMGMEVEVDRATGRIRVTHVACAHDCGQIVSPDGVRSQVEGSILQTISRTLFEEVTFDRSRVTSTDWSSYPILTFPDVPKLDIYLIDRPTERPLGAGEAATAPVAAALGNAVFDATGIRLRTVPFTPARVKAALEGREV
jgi:nicotinate dehydrogenase subunit B